jgi:hypothetical protein
VEQRAQVGGIEEANALEIRLRRIVGRDVLLDVAAVGGDPAPLRDEAPADAARVLRHQSRTHLVRIQVIEHEPAAPLDHALHLVQHSPILLIRVEVAEAGKEIDDEAEHVRRKR